MWNSSGSETCFLSHNALSVEDIGVGISILALVYFCQDIWIFMQEIGYEIVVAAKRHFHWSEGMRFTCKKILFPRMADNS